MPRPHHLLPCALLLTGLTASAVPAAPPPERLSFEQHVRPILKAYCLDCHGAEEKPKGKLDLRLRRFMLAGGRSGPALVAGQPGKSLLLERIRSGEMPPGEKKVPADQVAVLERWIAAGALSLRDEPVSLPPGLEITPEERAYWLYQPVKRLPTPAFAATDRVRTPVDAFILARLRDKGLAFNPDADRSTLIPRVSYDLTGLPPTPEAVEAFVADTRPDAYERLVDQLLASPRYGERWGRHWLDVAGYADSDGDGTTDTVRPHAWKYRDWVIRSLNADKPIDRFVTEQLAGDELVPRPWNNLTPAQVELLTATGYLRTAPDPTSSVGGVESAEQVVTDTLKIVGSSLLGLTVGCAQCHDHRYDPIPQADYFRLRAVFEPALNPSRWRKPGQRRVSLYTDADRARAAAVDAEAGQLQAAFNERQAKAVRAAFLKELEKFPAEQRPALQAAFDAPDPKRTPEQKKLVASNPKLAISPGVLYQYNPAAAEELKREQAAITAKRATRPVEDFLAVCDEVPGPPPATRVFHRGDYRQPKQEVGPGDLTVLAPSGSRREIAAKDPALPSTGRRLAYARHLTSGTHPLLGRVLMNRVWLHHFGRGLADTPGDLGVLGQRPTHPELLDWLADELVRQGWSLKAVHRLLLTSTVYRQSSRRDPRQEALDPANALFGRYALRRLEAEVVRDRTLLAAGRLDLTLGGPPVEVAEDSVGQVIVPADTAPAAARRSVYVQNRRKKPVAFLTTFDAPAGELNCDKRTASTSSPQALMLMNSDFMLHQAGQMARRVQAEAPLTATQDPRHARHQDAWSYGFGEYDAKSGRLGRFTALRHWTGSSWQAGPALPDPKDGWVLLHAAGGHAGNDQSHAAVRRWTAPADGTLTLTGKLHHAGPGGDGVRGRVVSSRRGLLGEWVVKGREVVTSPKPFAVQAGDTVDLTTDCFGDVNSDSFAWSARLGLANPLGEKVWDATIDFRGPQPSLASLVDLAWRLSYQRVPSAEERDLACDFLAQQTLRLRAAGRAEPELVALTNLCQQLLASNEFLHVE